MTTPNVHTESQLHIVYGRILYTTGVPALTSNDGSASVADTGSGNCTVTFGQAFLSAPQVIASPLKATHDAADQDSVTVEQATTTTAEFRFLLTNDAGAASNVTSPDPADGDGLMFIAIGLRDI
jgi:hypothetical protein